MRPIEKQGWIRIDLGYEAYLSKNGLIQVIFEKNGNLSISSTKTNDIRDTKLTLEEIHAIYKTAAEIKNKNSIVPACSSWKDFD